MAETYERPFPVGTQRITTGCQYCAVGCGYNAFLVPDDVTQSQNLEGVSRFITPAMRQRVRFKGIAHDVAVAPDARCDLNKGNHSVRGGSQGHNLVAHDGKGASTKARLTSPKVRLKDGDWKAVTWTQLNELLGTIVTAAAEMTWDSKEKKIKVAHPEAVGAKVYEYQYLENTYAFTKLFYSAIGTPNVAYHDRPGAAGSSPGMKDAGLRPHDFSYEEVLESDVLVFIGTNPYENQSVFFMQHAVGKEMVVVDPRETATAAYAKETGGLHIGLPKLAIDSLVLYGVAREILVRWKAENNGSLDNYPWQVGRIAVATDPKWSTRRKSRALTFSQFADDFLKVDDESSTYRLENIASKYFDPQTAAAVLESLKDFADRIYPSLLPNESRKKVGIIYEKGMIWGFNYHNTAAVASLGLLLGAYADPGRFVGRVGGHQKGWANSKADLSEDFISSIATSPSYSEGYPFRNRSDTYSDEQLKDLSVHHNLDNHVFGPPDDVIVPGSEQTKTDPHGNNATFVTLNNGLTTKKDPDVRLLFIIGGNYLGQTNDAQRKREVLETRLQRGGKADSIHRPTKSQASNVLKIAEIYLERMQAGGLVAIHQDIFANPTSEFCDILIPAAGWGEDEFCRYNAQRRLKLYARFQDPPLHVKDEQRIKHAARDDASKLDPFLYRDMDVAENSEIYRHSPKPDWMIFRDLGRAIIRKLVPDGTAPSPAERLFGWSYSSDVADEMAVYSHRGLAGADKQNGRSMLGDLYLFGHHALELPQGSGIVHQILGAGNTEGLAPHLNQNNYAVSQVEGGDVVPSAIFGNQIATNGVILPIRGVDENGEVVDIPIDINGSNVDGSARGDRIKKIRGTLRSHKQPPFQDPPYNYVRADWEDIRDIFEEINDRSGDELFVTNGRFNHLWNNMFHHLRNDYVNERYPEDMPGTILEVNPNWAKGRGIANGDVVKVSDGNHTFTAVASLQNSVPGNGAFAMFSYPVRNGETFKFDGYVNNASHGYADGINPIAALKYGKANITKTGDSYQSAVRLGPTYEQRNQIQQPQEGLDLEMRELIVKKGLPRAFVHSSSDRAASFLNPDAFFGQLQTDAMLRNTFLVLLPTVMKYPKNASTGEPLIDHWHPEEIALANRWAESLGDTPAPPGPGGPTANQAMLDLLQAKQPIGAGAHFGIPAGSGTLSSLFAAEDYQAILDFLKTGTAIRPPHAGLPLVKPGDPNASAFYLQTGPGGVMSGLFNSTERDVISNWIHSLVEPAPTPGGPGTPQPSPVQPGETMNRYDRVRQILDESVNNQTNFGAHGPFWRNQTRDQFVAFSFAGQSLVTDGDGAGSGIIKALRGHAPFGVDIGTPGAFFRRMPAGRPPVPNDQIAFIETWINEGCPEDPFVPPGGPTPATITIAPNSGGPVDPQVHLDYWRDFDNWAMFEATPAMQQDINTVMGVASQWMAYAMDPSLEAQWEGISVGSSLVLDPTLRIADRQIETLAKHYGNPIPLLTVMDGYERFGADTLPDDPARPADVRHNMNGPTMWFFWSAFTDTCLRHGASHPSFANFLAIWQGHARAILLGLMNDGIFRGRFNVVGFTANQAGQVAMRNHVRTLADSDLIGEQTKRFAESGFGGPVPTPPPTPVPPPISPAPGGQPPSGGTSARRVYRIHPSIGIARIGNSVSEFYIGPEAPGLIATAGGSYRDGTPDRRLKRQGARFRIYEYEVDEFGAARIIREVTGADASITWSVHLANRKGAGENFPPTSQHNLRNPSVADRNSLIINAGKQSVGGADQSGGDMQGSFLGASVKLGNLRTDTSGRLVVLGGHGTARSVPSGTPIISFANNDKWYDDISDGPVTATVQFSGQQPVEAEPAWVVVASPAYAPGIENMMTWYDQALDIGHRFFNPGGGLSRPSFTRDIYLVLRRTVLLQWVSESLRFVHGSGGREDFLRPDYLQKLADKSTATRPDREKVFNVLVQPGTRAPSSNSLPSGPRRMPQLYSGVDPNSVFESAYATLTEFQYQNMSRWAAGDFDDDWTGSPPVPVPFNQIPLEQQPNALVQAALEACIGGPFFPGIESGFMMAQASSYESAFRIKRTLPPGSLTQWMALPWQADFLACGRRWWPAQRPNSVKRNGQFASYAPTNWGYEDMVRAWWKLGFVLEDGSEFTEQQSALP